MTDPADGGALAASGQAADSNFPNHGADDPVQPCAEKTWVAIELKDKQGRPVAGEPYRIDLPDGRIVEGVLDALGTSGKQHIDPGTCRITFPRLDARSWRPAAS